MVDIEGAENAPKKQKRRRTVKKTVNAGSAGTPGTGTGGHPMVATAFIDLNGYTDWMHGAGYTEEQILSQAAQGIRGFLRGLPSGT